ncbi:uncharacterized protein LOC106644088 [Copidosoma floridanum]|uniref:uncharacterized protein LOC106644088 n=1 Tax=Copidosoma floridanum TaxID=29053 RepID=UPI0006C93E74|nr:uncharacterized protein LOC106644088 [Copidosoma floridanum]
MARPRIKRIQKIVRKKEIVNQDDSYLVRKRRSSLRVNLSFVSNLSDTERTHNNDDYDNDAAVDWSGAQNDKVLQVETPSKIRKIAVIHQVSEDTATTPGSVGNVTVIDAANRRPLSSNKNNVNKKSKEARSNTRIVIEEKELQLNKSCMQLKDAIMSKTKALFDEENELAIKTSEILTGHSPIIAEPELDELRDQRTPSVKVNIGKNQQIVMSGDGKNKHPVEVNAMKCQSKEKEALLLHKNDGSDNDDCYMDCNQSIVSTPKKIRLSDNGSKNDKSISRISDTGARIPVARLFVSTTDFNRTVSDLHLVQSLSSQKLNEPNEADKSSSEKAEKSLVSNFINQSGSPILSQGKRSKFSLTLKKKLTSTSSEESFLNKQPLISSSLIEKKSDSDKSCPTIYVDNSKDNSKTINIDDSTSKSCMEITTISSHMPIVRRSFQNEIRKSLKLNSISILQNDSQLSTQLNKNTGKNSNLPVVEKAHSSNDYQEDCSVNTIRTSLNVNTSLDRITSVDSIAQKENKTPNNSTSTEISSKNQVEENNTTTVQRQSTFIIPTAKPKKSLLLPRYSTKNKHQMEKRSDKISGSPSTDYNKQNGNSNVACQKSSPTNNQEKGDNDKIILSRQPSISTVRSSLQVNTSLDSVRKSPVAHNVLDFNKMVTMIEETTSHNNQSEVSTYSSNNQSCDSDDDQEGISLMERLRNISKSKKNESREPSPKSKSKSISDSKRKKILGVDGTDSSVKRQSTNIEHVPLYNTRKSSKSRYSRASTSRKSRRFGNMSNEASIVETTPYPASRSLLLKTIIKNNIAMNTIDPKKFIDLSDNNDYNDEEDDVGDDGSNTNFDVQTVHHKTQKTSSKRSKSIRPSKKPSSPRLMDTILVYSSDESSNESEQDKKRVVIEESINVTKVLDKSNKNKSIKEKSNNKYKLKRNNKLGKQRQNEKSANKRKLYALRDNSLISFSPSDIQEIREDPRPRTIKRKTKKRHASLTKKPEIVDENKSLISPELCYENEPEEIDPQQVVKKKKQRKRLRKKIVVKKINSRLLDNLTQDEDRRIQRMTQRDSMKEFDLRNMLRKDKNRQSHRIVIVVTGLPRGDKDLVKSVIKALGSAVLELNVTPRTTHVISTGVRTINLLKGILRGCWLLSLEWALKSLESGKWLDPSPYEMSHFAKAVQENRKDRQLFGKAYVPELFVTCGLIYIENGTSPPAPVLKELVKIAGGRITEYSDLADIEIGPNGLKEIWILDSITTGEVQSFEQYKEN